MNASLLPVGVEGGKGGVEEGRDGAEGEGEGEREANSRWEGKNT